MEAMFTTSVIMVKMPSLHELELIVSVLDPPEEVGAVFGDEVTFNLHEAGKEGVDEKM